MSGDKSYHHLNYQDNARHYERYAPGADLEADARTWLDPHTVDAWRHGRMYATLDPLLESDLGMRWLTVGDGRYGKDARYLAQHGADAVASDLDDTLLAEAEKIGFIKTFSRQNAESLTFADDSFDYVLCKESFHHFPRPMLALYEMLRVSIRGVVLIEPGDRFISYSLIRRWWQWVTDSMLCMLNRGVARHSFEEFGNYVYCISRRELEKVALGMNYRYLAFKGLNDHYVAGVEHENVAHRGRLLRLLKAKIMLRDVASKLKMSDHAMLVAILFKQPPAKALRDRLTGHGYELVELPENPYPHGSRTEGEPIH